MTGVDDVVLGWEGVTARRGEARFGRESLGPLPRHVRGAEIDRVVRVFRERYQDAQRRVDRRAGVRSGIERPLSRALSSA